MSRIIMKRSLLSLLTTASLGGVLGASVALAEDGGMSLAEAVKMTLELSPSRYIQQAGVNQAKAGVTINEGVFNPTPSAGFNVGQNSAPLASVPYAALANGPFSQAILQRLDNGTYTFNCKPNGLCFGPGPDTPFRYQNTDVASFHAEMSKLFQNGVSASVGVLNTRIIQRNLSTISRPNANNAQVTLNVNIPLLKNRGTTSAAGRLNAARKQEEAATNDYKFFLTALANGAIAAYWDYRLAVDSLAIREASRDRVMRITNEVNKFVADPDPRKEARLREQLAQVIFTAEGARVNKNRAVNDYKQFMEAAKTNFALTLGVPPEQFNTIRMPAEEIPDGIIPSTADLNKMRNVWHKAALESRLDLQAARQRQQAADFLVKKAERDLYAQLDLSGSIGYQGLQEGNRFDDMWNAYGTNVHNPNWSTGLEFRYPIGNQVARGTLDSSKAQYRQAELGVYEKTRQIDATIDINVGLVERYIETIGKAEQASKELKDALAAWKRTPLTDPSAILGMLQTEAQYTESLLAILGIRTEYAKLVADIRFKTGQLGKNGDSMEDYVINFSEVSQLPI